MRTLRDLWLWCRLRAVDPDAPGDDEGTWLLGPCESPTYGGGIATYGGGIDFDREPRRAPRAATAILLGCPVSQRAQRALNRPV